MKKKGKEKSIDQKETEALTYQLEETRRQLTDLQQERDELFEKLQRVSADYINFQKRTARQTSDTVAYEKERIIKTLLPVLDNFEHTLQNAGTAEEVDVLVKGIQIIYDQMLDILKSHGAEQIKAVGEKFDPAVHEAMMQKTEREQEENIVLEEFQKGYRLNGRVIRPSKVIVNKIEEALQQESGQGPKEEEAAAQKQAPDEADTPETED